MILKDFLQISIDGGNGVICVIKGGDEASIADAKKMLLEGKYWILNSDTSTSTPALPEALLEKHAAPNVFPGLLAERIVVAPDFDQDAYWATVTPNAPLFPVKTNLSCARILEIDAAHGSLVEDFKAMAAANNLTADELVSYLFEKL